MRNKAIGSVIAAAGLGALCGTAQAQIWIGQIVGNMIAQEAAAQREEACMTGTAMSDKEVAEARSPALATMQGYFADAKAGVSFEPRFQPDKKSLWTGGGASPGVGVAGMSRQHDGMAGGDTVLEATPLGFVRAGDGSSAFGQWLVRDPAGKKVGTYSALFTRRAGIWRLSTLGQSPAAAYVDPVVQYCHKPGDVLPYRLSSTKWLREAAEKRVAKAEKRAREADARAADPKAPVDARERADSLGRQLARQREALDSARAAEAQAQADAKAAEDAKAAATASLGG
jgi:hypothetical protein